MSFDVKWYKKPKIFIYSKTLILRQGLSWRAFYRKELKLPKNLIINKVEPFSHFAWIASGGYCSPVFTQLFV